MKVIKKLQCIFLIILLFFKESSAADHRVVNALNLAHAVAERLPVIKEAAADHRVVNALNLAGAVAEGLPVVKKTTIGGSDFFDWISGIKKDQKEPNANPKSEVKITEIPVLQQGSVRFGKQGVIDERGLSWEDIQKFQGGNCGYHALLNVYTLMQDRRITVNFDSISPEVKANLLSSQWYQNHMQKWGPIIFDFRGRTNISWLGGEELEYLIMNLDPYQEIHVFEYVPRGGLKLNEQELRAIQQFVASSQNQKLGFVWNSGVREHLGQTGGVHWVGFVAVKNENRISLYYLNSSRGLDPDFQLIESFFSNPVVIQDMLNEQIEHVMQSDIGKLSRGIEIFNDTDKYNVRKINDNEWRFSINSHGERFDNAKFLPNEMLTDIFRVCLVSWRDYQRWPELIQREMTELLIQYLKIAAGNRKQAMLNVLGREHFDLMTVVENVLEKLPATVDQHRRIRQLAADLIIAE